jgi:hypothetical protein
MSNKKIIRISENHAINHNFILTRFPASNFPDSNSEQAIHHNQVGVSKKENKFRYSGDINGLILFFKFHVLN